MVLVLIVELLENLLFCSSVILILLFTSLSLQKIAHGNKLVKQWLHFDIFVHLANLAHFGKLVAVEQLSDAAEDVDF